MPSNTVVVCLSGSGYGHSPSDYLLHERAGHRLLQALHEPWNQYHDQEAGETKTRRLLLHGPSVFRNMDVYNIRLPGRLHRTVSR